ncbi:unnamed protein product [Caenorhabditis bovis]|uniref:Mannosyltransferase n=1 Tax=Caenorhabditis bovis TaxID=2654633 RepID=A0A8S1DZZ9_9PELO|nr:unnamed protein product [Caenorhabditis bovis]
MDAEKTEWVVIITAFVHLLMAPGTKVEESFNVQATHDILFHMPTNLSNYDHRTFPGVVPRTFIGPIFLAALSAPMSFIFRIWLVPKMWQLVLVRGTLGFLNVLAFLNFCRSVKIHFGADTANFLRLIVASQFHYLFYASRPLPNTFALTFVMLVFERILENRIESAVRWATAATVLFRCELLLLFGPLFIKFIINHRLPLFGTDGALANGLRVSSLCLAVTMPIDSYFWGRPVWPEGEVALFNVIQNRSHEYGTSPFLWYFYSALPRALLLSAFLVPLGVLLDRRLRSLIIPCVAFVFLYSFLPHKELRFIIYVFPIFNLSAAVFCARMYINRAKSMARFILYLGCLLHLIGNLVAAGTLLYVSSRNYPGTDAINYLHLQMRFDALKPVTVYIDNACAQTGVSRFLQMNDAWTYNKTEHLKPEDLKDFDFLVLGTYGTKLKEEVQANFTTYHRPMFYVTAFHKYKLRKSKKFPFYYPEIILKEKAVVLKNKEYK